MPRRAIRPLTTASPVKARIPKSSAWTRLNPEISQNPSRISPTHRALNTSGGSWIASGGGEKELEQTRGNQQQAREPDAGEGDESATWW